MAASILETRPTVKIPAVFVLVLLLPLTMWAQGESVDYDSRFTFTRIRYGSGWGRGGGSWAHDYPRADEHLPKIIAELSTMKPRVDRTNVYDLDDPAIFLNPIIYISEPGFWTVAERGAANMRAPAQGRIRDLR